MIDKYGNSATVLSLIKRTTRTRGIDLKDMSIVLLLTEHTVAESFSSSSFHALLLDLFSSNFKQGILLW